MRTASLLAALAALALTSAGCAGDETTEQPKPTPQKSTTGPLGERADLPVDERIVIEHLSAPVDVVRDKWGRPHIYAANLADAMRAEGYLVARDRHLQLEFFRRASEGRLAEILADSDPSLIDVDISYRHIGLHRVAKKQYEQLAEGSELRQVLDAYADGISQVFQKIRAKEIKLPEGIFGIPPEAFTDWSGADSLAIGRLQTHLLSYDADVDIQNQVFFNLARSTYKADDADPALARRAGIERDLFRLAPADPATTTTGYPGAPQKAVKTPKGAAGKAPQFDAKAFLDATGAYLRARQWSRSVLNPDGFGSNNWAVSAERSASGHAMVASDPHLTLSAPSIFWPVSIEVKGKAPDPAQDLVVAGIAFPGIPGIILGHNEHIAWGATVAGYDVSDAYQETLGKDGDSVVFNGQEVKLETIDEVIAIQGRDPYTYKVRVVPHHGPVFPAIQPDHTVAPVAPERPTISIRWTGMEATNEIGAVVALLRARDVDEARGALKQFAVGAQNWMLADTQGSVLWTSHANVPIRDPKAFQWDPATYSGTLPCLILPGDGSAEWKGYLPDDLVPWEKNPAKGWLSTANNDPIGDTLDNDPTNDTLPDGSPMYLACSFDIGFREGRIHERLEAKKEPLTTDDLASIQADVRSAMGKALAPALVTAIERAEEERKKPGTHPDLAAVVADPAYAAATMTLVHDLLVAWDKEANYEAASGIDPETNGPLPEAGATATEAKAARATLIFNAWMMRLLHRTFSDEIGRMGPVALGREPRAKALLRLVQSDPAQLATYDMATGDSALWDDLDTPAIESRHERMIRALLDALGELSSTLGPDPAPWRWGARHTVKFTALISFFGKLSIPPDGDPTFPSGFPRHGDWFSVDSSDYPYFGPAEPLKFGYSHGPTQRFVIEMDPAGPKAFNALPGGAVWDAASPHFRDEAELWRKNQTHAVPFLLGDVIASKESRTVAAAP